MSISSVTSKVVYVGTGSTAAAAKVFAYPFKILAATDLTVSEYNNTTSAAIVKTLSTHYDVSGVGSSGGGNVTITGSYTNLPTGCQLVIQRIMDLTQETDYVENDAFSAETHETALDRLTMITQQLQEQLDRAVLANITQTSPDLDVIANANAAKSSAVVAMGVANSLDRFDDGSQGTENLLSNGDFENWSAGTSVAPDGWTLSGASATVAREGTIIKLGTYSAKVTRAGTDCYLYNTNYNVAPILGKGIEYWKGRKITIGCWVYATVAARARLSMTDNVNTANSSYHTGDSTWQWLTMTMTFDSSATLLVLYLQVNNGNTSAYFDGLMCVEGESIFAFSEGITPIPLGTAAAVLTANKGPAGCTAVTGWIAINIAGVQRFIPYW